jgi:hypothetical protein
MSAPGERAVTPPVLTVDDARDPAAEQVIAEGLRLFFLPEELRRGGASSHTNLLEYIIAIITTMKAGAPARPRPRDLGRHSPLAAR